MAKGRKYCKHNKLLSVRADLNTRWPEPVVRLEVKMALPTGVTIWGYHLGLPAKLQTEGVNKHC